MAVTNYYSVGGTIIGERTAGSTRIDYLTDALGSVTATVDQTGTVQNTYRYKPYGMQLSKTGVTTDTFFQWNGRNGYRQSSGHYSNIYVRARHYGTLFGQWTSVDPLGRILSYSQFRYADCNVTTLIDPSGLFTVTSMISQGVVLISGTSAPSCAQQTVLFGLTRDNNSTHGYLVQKITKTESVYTCAGQAAQNTTKVFWEAFELWPKSKPIEDEVSVHGQVNNQDTVTDTHEVRFYPYGVAYKEIKLWGENCYGINTDSCTYNTPNFWKNSVGTERPVSYNLTAYYVCCPGCSLKDPWTLYMEASWSSSG